MQYRLGSPLAPTTAFALVLLAAFAAFTAISLERQGMGAATQPSGLSKQATILPVNDGRFERKYAANSEVAYRKETHRTRAVPVLVVGPQRLPHKAGYRLLCAISP